MIDADLLAKVINPFPDRRKGWHTIREIAEATGVSFQTTSDRLVKLSKSGKCEREKAMVTLADGRKAPCWVYRTRGGGSCTKKMPKDRSTT